MKKFLGYSSKYLRENHNEKILNTLKNRFYAKVLLPNEDGCMRWVGTKSDQGYGLIYINHRNIKAHRFSYQIHYGEIAKKMEILHICDNPICVNPLHLRMGTHKDNMIDCKNKNRVYKIPPRLGEFNNKTKLKKEEIITIREMLAKNIRKKDIAKIYNVTKENIRHIELRKSWRNV